MAEHPHKAQEPPGRWARLRAWSASRPVGWRLAVPVAFACAGLLATTSMINARGTDLRGGRHTDLIGLVSSQRQSVQEVRRDIREIQEQVDLLAEQVRGTKIDEVRAQLDELEVPAGLERMGGPGLTVTLDDAERDQPGSEDIAPNLLVVHQQDLQAVVNALWAGGAEAISLQGQRIISTTGIKCVGNTVVLQGVPYSPPYRIAAVGNQSAMYQSLYDDAQVATYLQYTEAPYNLGWSLREDDDLVLPAYRGPLVLSYAEPATLP